MKSRTSSTKLQTNLKFQYQMTKTDLEFGIFNHSSRLPHEGKTSSDPFQGQIKAWTCRAQPFIKFALTNTSPLGIVSANE
jgi:hypothetical protein